MEQSPTGPSFHRAIGQDDGIERHRDSPGSADSQTGPDRGLIRLASNIGSNYVALLAQAAWLLALTPLLVSRRGAAEFGAWTIAQSLAGYLRLLDLGTGPTFARFVAADRARRPLDSLLSSSLMLLTALAIAGSLAGLVLAFVVPSIVHTRVPIGIGVGVVVVGSAVQIPLRLFGYMLYGLERLVEQNAFTVLRLVTSLAAVVISVLSGATLAGYLLAQVVAEIVVGVVQATWVLRTVPVRVTAAGVTRRTLSDITRFGSGTFALQAATQIVYYSDAVVIGAALGTVKAGVYGVAMRLVEGVNLVMSQAANAFMPMIARLHAGAGRDDARALALLGASVMAVLAAGPIVILVAAGGGLISIWVGHGYSGATTPLLLLALGLAFNVPLRFPVLWSLGAGRHHRIAAVALVEAFANVGLSIALVQPFGINGVAAATLVTLVVSNGIVIPRILTRELGQPGPSWYRRPLARCAAVAAPLGAIEWIILHGLPQDGLVTTMVAALLLGAGALAGSAAVTLDRTELREIGNVLVRPRTEPPL